MRYSFCPFGEGNNKKCPQGASLRLENCWPALTCLYCTIVRYSVSSPFGACSAYVDDYKGENKFGGVGWDGAVGRSQHLQGSEVVTKLAGNHRVLLRVRSALPCLLRCDSLYRRPKNLVPPLFMQSTLLKFIQAGCLCWPGLWITRLNTGAE